MEKARGNKPRDRETWFKLLPRRQQPQEQLIQIQQDQLDGMENTCEGFLILENDDSEDEDPELSVNNEDPNEGTHFEKTPMMGNVRAAGPREGNFEGSREE